MAARVFGAHLDPPIPHEPQKPVLPSVLPVHLNQIIRPPCAGSPRCPQLDCGWPMTCAPGTREFGRRPAGHFRRGRGRARQLRRSSPCAIGLLATGRLLTSVDGLLAVTIRPTNTMLSCLSPPPPPPQTGWLVASRPARGPTGLFRRRPKEEFDDMRHLWQTVWRARHHLHKPALG